MKPWQVTAVTVSRADGVGTAGIRHVWSRHWTRFGAVRESRIMSTQAPMFVHFDYIVERTAEAEPALWRANR